ncbi:hypothetical protein PP178_10260 [Zeaxanthinibacter sp. PT1]|uniref:hypothetical protein n=1 Tax=Zeaxanthinibacter TaxID=561554 RepID=UPI002349415A|nr:hypothetical protein [Zeaxanthinibacter sp. PT1]MDC6351937.1 hypothetical protein [Zeaxanthinibacter sp. PT1]
MKKKSVKIQEWLDPDSLHNETKMWISELDFMCDEQRFLNDLIKDFTIELTQTSNFEVAKQKVSELLSIENELVHLKEKVQLHGNQLKIMTDKVDQLEMESAYLKTHKNLSDHLKDYRKRYQELKTQFFKLLTAQLKKRKTKKLMP